MPIITDEEFLEWERGISEGARGDPVWKFNTYRVALFMADRAGKDVHLLRRKRVSAFQADQLLRSVHSVCANIAEGLGRSTPADRSRFFGMAIGSLREAITWYHNVASDLGEAQAARRDAQLVELRRLLIGSQKWLSAKSPRSHLM